MKTTFVAPLLAVAFAASVAPAGVTAQTHTAPEVLQAKEAALPPGTLPAWQTATERESLPLLEWAPPSDLPLPPPPAAGYRAPAEFEPVAAFLVSYEWHDLAGYEWGNWEAASYPMVLNMALHGTGPGGAPVIVLTRNNDNTYDPQNGTKVLAFFTDYGVDPARIHIPPDGAENNINLDAKWARDFGPISVYDGGEFGHLGFVDMHYYDGRPNDDLVPTWLAGLLGVNRYGLRGTDQDPDDAARLYMEGGNYQTDGDGTCILSNDIASDNSGNPDANTVGEVEALLAAYMGCEQVIWLTPPPNTGTGHVDMYAKLLGPTDILVIDFPNASANDNSADAVIENNVTILNGSTNMDGDDFDIHRVTIPSLGTGWTYRTYTNSVILNHRVLVPTYGYAIQDANALAAYEDVLGDGYTVIGIDSSAIVSQGGAVHCTTMQIASACGNGAIDDFLFERPP